MRSSSTFRWRSVQQFIPDLLLLGLCALLALVGFLRIVPSLIHRPPAIDFGAYYVAARVLNSHGDLFSQPTMQAAAQAAGNVRFTEYIYPPFLATLLRPLALLPYSIADVFWFSTSVVCYLIAIILVSHRLGFSWRFTGAAIVLGVLVPAVYDTWFLGQTGLLLTALLVGSFWFSTTPVPSRTSDVLAGVLWGLAIGIKVYPGALGLVYVVHRRVVTIAVAAITAALTLVVGAWSSSGWATTWLWWTTVVPSITVRAGFPSNQSLLGVFQRFFAEQQFQIPVLRQDNGITVTLRPLIQAPALGTSLAYALCIIVVCISLWQMERRRRQADTMGTFHINIALGTVVMLLVTPVMWDNYFVHLVIPVLVLIRYGWQPVQSRRLLLLTSVFLIAQRSWRIILLYAQTPWLMLFGCLGLLILLIALTFFSGVTAERRRKTKDERRRANA